MDNIKGKAKEISDDIGLGVEGESKAGTKLHLSNENAKHERSAEEDAAIVVQRAWRHYSIRKNNSSTDARWKDALINAEKEAVNEEAERGDKNDPRSRFRRGVFLAGRLEDGDALMTTTEEHDPTYTKALETQHWLELVDPKHRYGSNLKVVPIYNISSILIQRGPSFITRSGSMPTQWTTFSGGKGNLVFFILSNVINRLDKGEGKDLSLPECSREQLESERIIFLSAEQRLNYLIKIDPDGKIRWDHNNEYVDTAPEKWKDAGDGKGIVSSDDDTKGKDDGKPKSGKLADVVNSVTKSESSSSVADQARHYEGIKQDQNMNTLQRIWKDRFTTKGLTQRVLRKTVQKNTWIYVSVSQ
ncbi:hypothetical protein FRB91_011974 [Serendipita sp. 411]|nr:hypothetical protein FRB91_011974 [Serendipita sp. 411]